MAFCIGVVVIQGEVGLRSLVVELGELGDGSGWLEGSEWLGLFAWVAVHNGGAKGVPMGPNVVVVSR